LFINFFTELLNYFLFFFFCYCHKTFFILKNLCDHRQRKINNDVYSSSNRSYLFCLLSADIFKLYIIDLKSQYLASIFNLLLYSSLETLPLFNKEDKPNKYSFLMFCAEKALLYTFTSSILPLYA